MKDNVTVLLVEDDDVDAERVARAFRKAGAGNPIRRARDGVEALAVLRKETTTPIEKPYTILLDLKMPRMGGLRFIDELRQDRALREAVVFVLTTSKDEGDKLAAYTRNVAGYVRKARTRGHFGEIVDMLKHYWTVVELP